MDSVTGRLRDAVAVARHLAGHNRLGRLGLAIAHCLVLHRDLLQVVDVVHEAAVDLIHFGSHVARHGDVDEEHGPILAALQHGARTLRRKHLAGARAGDDDVGAMRLLMQLIERNHAGGDGRSAQSRRRWPARFARCGWPPAAWLRPAE